MLQKDDRHDVPLENYAPPQAPQEEYRPRPVWQLVLAGFLALVVLFGFLGVCYWMIFYR